MNKSLYISIIILTALFFACGNPTAKDTAKDREYDARIAAKTAIKQLLVSPSSAEFGEWHFEWDNPNERVTVTGIVESRNRFGVMLQSPFKVLLQIENDGKQMRILDAKLVSR